jgi:hypothetical protein
VALTGFEEGVIVAVVTGVCAAVASGLVTVRVARRERIAARTENAVSVIEARVNTVSRRVRRGYTVDEADQDELERVLAENTLRIPKAVVRQRLDQIRQVVSWILVVAPDDAAWPAFQTVEEELRELLGAYAREERPPRPTPRFTALYEATMVVEKSIEHVTPEELAEADEELRAVYGDDWKEHAHELLFPPLGDDH